MMEYRGYIARVEFDDSVGRLHGRVVNSGAYPIATFEAVDVDGLAAESGMSLNGWIRQALEKSAS